jgi:hypothetical protein
MAEHLPSKHKAPSSNPSTPPKINQSQQVISTWRVQPGSWKQGTYTKINGIPVY